MIEDHTMIKTVTYSVSTVSTEILTLGLTIGAIWIAFKYIGRDEETSQRKDMAAWLQNLIAKFVSIFTSIGRVITSFGGVVAQLAIVVMLIAWYRAPSSRERAKVEDPESLKQDHQARSTAKSLKETPVADVPRSPRTA